VVKNNPYCGFVHTEQGNQEQRE